MKRAFFGVTLALAAVVTVASAGEPDSSRVELLRSDDREIVVWVVFAHPESGGTVLLGGPAADLHVPGLPRTRALGESSLPFRSVLVALPPGAEYALSIDAPERHRLPGQPAPFRLVASDEPGSAPATDPPRSTPPLPVEVQMDGYLRDRRVVRLVFHPLIPVPGEADSFFYPSLSARLQLSSDDGGSVFGEDPEKAAAVSGPGRPVEEHIYRSTILNEHRVDKTSYEAALERARLSEPAPHEDSPERTGSIRNLEGTGLAVKVPVDRAGVWSVTYADILAEGVDPAGTPIASVSLRSDGADLPLRVIDGGDGLFGPGDRVEFFGIGVPFDPDFDEKVYRIAFGETTGVPPATRSAVPAGGSTPSSFPHTERFELNEGLFTTASDSDGDYISWDRLVAPSSGSPPTTRDFPDASLGEPSGLITLQDPDPSGTTVTLRARVYRLGGASHTTNVLLNGVDLLDAQSWSGTDITHEITTSTANLIPANTVTLELSGPSFNQVLMNWIEIEYPRLFVARDDELNFAADGAAPVAHQVTGFTTPDIVVYDVTDASAPVLLTGTQVSGSAGSHTVSFTDTLGGARSFVARAGAATPPGTLLADNPSNLQNPSNGADFIILSYRDFLDELGPLALARTDQGMRVSVVDLEDVYDEFSFSRRDPAAIKDFVTTAFNTWQAPAPAYLLLVGNATLDPKQHLTGSVPSLMPSGTFTAPSLGLASTDNYFVTVAGADPLADLFVGRIPAQTEQEVTDAVSRILAYDEIDPDLLNDNVLLVADNDSNQFEAIQEDMVSLHLSGTRIPAERAYLRLLGAAPTNQRILDTINAGALLGSYLGHGNIHNWAAEDVFVDSVDVPQLTNADRPTFLATMNCINGLHAGPRAPNVSSLAEQVLLATGGGAIGVWSPSAVATLVDYEDISNVLFRQIFTDRNQTIGAVTTAAKIEAFTDLGVSAVNLEEMTLFGDPTVVLRVDGDRDGLTDAEEDGCDCGLDPRDADGDDDGLTDGAEPGAPTDSDGDGLPDFLDPDADDDGLPDGLEAGIDVPDQDTDLSAGYFRPDLDPFSTTDATLADSDGGGAADGAEDRDRDGFVGGAETDPENPADDPACAPAPLPELQNLQLGVDGVDLVLSWDDIQSQDPCVLYRIVEADPGAAPVLSLPPFYSRRVTTESADTLPGEAAAPSIRWYLVLATRPDLGDGPSGH